MAAKKIERYEELVCYQLSYTLKCEIFAMTSKGPAYRDFKFRDQIRDSGRGAPRAIAEGFGRRAPRDVARFLTYAESSLLETRNHLKDAYDSGYIEERLFTRLNNLAGAALRATAGLRKSQIRLADKWNAEKKRRKSLLSIP
jgi:four helix bundle protein